MFDTIGGMITTIVGKSHARLSMRCSNMFKMCSNEKEIKKRVNTSQGDLFQSFAVRHICYPHKANPANPKVVKEPAYPTHPTHLETFLLRMKKSVYLMMHNQAQFVTRCHKKTAISSQVGVSSPARALSSSDTKSSAMAVFFIQPNRYGAK